jgi:hypothetical protein
MNLSKKLFAPLLAVAVLALALVAVVAPPYKAAHAETARVSIFSEAYTTAFDLADGAGATEAVNAPGAILGDACLASLSVDAVGMSITCSVSAAGAVKVRVQNESGGATDIAAGTLRVFVFPRGTR